MDVQRIKLHRGGLQEKRDLLNQIKDDWVTEGKYFFNSENSPASLDEQKHLAKCAGGWKVLQRSASPLRMDILNEMQRYTIFWLKSENILFENCCSLFLNFVNFRNLTVLLLLK